MEDDHLEDLEIMEPSPLDQDHQQKEMTSTLATLSDESRLLAVLKPRSVEVLNV